MTIDEAVAAAAKRASEQLDWHKAAAAKWSARSSKSRGGNPGSRLNRNQSEEFAAVATNNTHHGETGGKSNTGRTPARRAVPRRAGGRAEMKLTEKHMATLRALGGTGRDVGYLTFAGIARQGVDRKDVRRAVRHLARKGLAEYSRGLWSEDGMPAGSGYAITEAGSAILAAAHQEGGEPFASLSHTEVK